MYHITVTYPGKLPEVVYSRPVQSGSWWVWDLVVSEAKMFLRASSEGSTVEISRDGLVVWGPFTSKKD